MLDLNPLDSDPLTRTSA
uniref:Uncharacterized protein n=1 Tax=Anguilla anguilla TaxID=7936 RepID=A0A0E9TGM7_ANGAN